MKNLINKFKKQATVIACLIISLIVFVVTEFCATISIFGMILQTLSAMSFVVFAIIGLLKEPSFVKFEDEIVDYIRNKERNKK